MKRAYIALGTNIEPRETHFIKGLEKIAAHRDITIKNISSIYETEPVGYTDQADFLNMVVEVETTLSPFELLRYCQSIENELGRERTIRFGPRTIDLDIILYGEEHIEHEDLLVPHSRMHERVFVLVPLVEIAPTAQVVTENLTASELLATLPEEEQTGIKKWPSED